MWWKTDSHLSLGHCLPEQNTHHWGRMAVLKALLNWIIQDIQNDCRKPNILTWMKCLTSEHWSTYIPWTEDQVPNASFWSFHLQMDLCRCCRYQFHHPSQKEKQYIRYYAFITMQNMSTRGAELHYGHPAEFKILQFVWHHGMINEQKKCYLLLVHQLLKYHKSRRGVHVLTFTKSPPCIIKSLITLTMNKKTSVQSDLLR